MQANESLNLSATVSIKDANNNAISLVRLSATINGTGYGIQIQIVNPIEVDANLDFVNTEVNSFKSLLQERVSNLGGKYLG